MNFSIVIPAYGQAEYLPDAIESAMNQTVPCEIIVVIDGSLDNSYEVAKRYPVRVIQQVNKGLASARNTGIMNMRGDVFLPLDADDMLQETCVEKMYHTFQKTDADVVAPSMKTFGDSSEEIIVVKDPSFNDFKVGNRIPYCSAVKKEVLLECGGYSPRMDKGWEDFHLWIDLLTRGKKIVTLQEPLMLYRTKNTSMWKESKKHQEELYKQIHKDFPHYA